MATATDIATTLAEARDIQSELLKILDTKKAWENDDQKKAFHARVNHIQLKSELHGKGKKLNVDLNDLDKLAVAGLIPSTPSASTSTTTPAAPATPTTITKKIEPQPIIWLGRGYMGDAND